MKDSYHIFLKKSEESMNTARLCFEKAYYNSCVNRAYYAMFQAAVAVLFKAGIRPKSKIGHGWVQAEFSKAFVRGSKKFSRLKGFLNLVQEVRNIADYSDEYIDKKKAKRTLDKAVVFFEEISKEIRK
ncbi:HEPN domain-containing protein [Desulfococcaceae bacterium HSG8]|nr:HEPN domain-containing protein [Desulfococcaceae bacterium HSG8]